jgi:hypothetical protein
MTINSLLLVLMAWSVLVWVGGAITGQIWMFRAGQRRDFQLRATLIPYINWIIRTVYIPMASTALTCGLILIWRLDIPFATPWIAFPLSVFFVTIIVGSVYSLPEYGRLITLLDHGTPHDKRIHQRIELAAWVNRIELLFVLLAIGGLVAQIPIE